MTGSTVTLAGRIFLACNRSREVLENILIIRLPPISYDGDLVVEKVASSENILKWGTRNVS
jgi:hypothetical protein